MILLAGDVLLYKPSSIYGKVIAIKTWHAISHVECYIGNAQSVASRDGIGTGQYPVRLSGLCLVCRPTVPVDLTAALAWFQRTPHRPYGWRELAAFVGAPVPTGPTDGIVCSPFVTEFLRAGGLDPFNGDLAQNIAPFQFEDADCFTKLPYAPGVLLA